ncbi:MAG TPA: PAS domain S-box protein [Acetobacteraceae bacterium]|nr:PAS domain S-box protein [Acetobacteraceae bacterium]
MADHPDTSESVWSRLLLRAGGLSALSSGKIITLSLIGPLGLACVFGAMVLKSRTDRLNEAVFNGEAISSWLSQDIAGDLNPCDMALRAVAETMGRPDVAMRPDGARLLPPIRHPGAVCPGHLLVLNEAGDIVADGEAARSRPETLAAIGALAALRRAGDTGLRVSRPFRGPFDASWTIGLGRRLSRPEGGFAGEALVLLPLGHLRTLLDRPPLRYGTVVALMHADGMLLLTRPYGEDRIGRDLRDGSLFRATTGGVSGSFAASAPAGILPPAGNPPGGGDAPPAGGRWIYSFSRAGDLPLIVCVGLARSTLLRDWRSEVLAAGMVVAALSAGCAFLIFLLLQELRRRRAAEEAACLSEERYRLLAEHSSDAIVLHDGEGQRRYASPAFHRLIGRHRADLPDEALLASVHPDHRDRLAACRRNIRRMQGETAIEFLYGRADGHWVWLEARCRPVLDAQGRQRGLVSNLRDITRRKLAEDELARRVMTDSLTGLANRRCFDEALERHWSREAEAWMPIDRPAHARCGPFQSL